MTDREKQIPMAETGEEQERILVVDDDPSMRIALMETIERLGYAVQRATDGTEALERITKFRPWLVLTDLRMPRLTGLELIKEMKGASPANGDCPRGLRNS